jgi:hypothetical protein
MNLNTALLDELWLLICDDDQCDLLEDIPDRILIKLTVDLLDNLISDHSLSGKTWQQCLGMIEWAKHKTLTSRQRYWLYQTLKEHRDQMWLFRHAHEA